MTASSGPTLTSKTPWGWALEAYKVHFNLTDSANEAVRCRKPFVNSCQNEPTMTARQQGNFDFENALGLVHRII